MNTKSDTTMSRSSTRGPWFYLTAAVIAEGPATASLRAGLDNPWFYTVSVLGFILVFYNLAQAMKRGIGVGIAYGVCGACSVILTAVLSWILFSEPFTTQMILGIALIILVVMCVEFGKFQRNSSSTTAVTS